MKSAPFKYAAPEKAAEAYDLLSSYGESASVLAGGQSLVPRLVQRLARPRVLIDVGRLENLDHVEDEGHRLTVGARITQARLERHPALRRLPVLSDVLHAVGTVSSRNVGTVAGSIAHADPGAELPVALLALGGDVVVGSARATRTVPAAEFFLGAHRTAIAPDELVTHLRWPVPADGVRAEFAEFTLRGPADVALVAALAVRDREGRGRVALGGVAGTPVLISELPPPREMTTAWVRDVTDGLDPRSDARAPGSVRRRLAGVLLRRLLDRIDAPSTRQAA